MNKNAPAVRRLFIIGLLLGVILPIILRNHASDGVRGVITGVGIGLMLLALIRRYRQPGNVQ